MEAMMHIAEKARDFGSGKCSGDLLPLVVEAYIAGAMTYHSLPLEERLSEDEIDKIRRLYQKARQYQDSRNIGQVNIGLGAAAVLENIFDKSILISKGGQS